MTLQKLGKHLVLYGRCSKRWESFKSWSKDLLVISVNVRCLIAFSIFQSYGTLLSQPSEAAVLISIIQETARTVRQPRLYLLVCHCDWKVSWGGWGGLIAIFISTLSWAAQYYPLFCAISAPLTRCPSRWFALHNPRAQTGLSKARGEACTREAAWVFGSVVWERSSLRSRHVKPFPREY